MAFQGQFNLFTFPRWFSGFSLCWWIPFLGPTLSLGSPCPSPPLTGYSVHSWYSTEFDHLHFFINCFTFLLKHSGCAMVGVGCYFSHETKFPESRNCLILLLYHPFCLHWGSRTATGHSSAQSTLLNLMEGSSTTDQPVRKDLAAFQSMPPLKMGYLHQLPSFSVVLQISTCNSSSCNSQKLCSSGGYRMLNRNK